MNLADRSWLITFAKPSLLFAFIMGILILAIVHHKRLTHVGASTAALALFACLSIGYLRLITPNNPCIKSIVCFDNEITFIRAGGKALCIDNGALGSRVSSPSWTQHTLVPMLIKSENVSQLEYVIALKPSITTFRALTALCQKLLVKTIVMVEWKGKLNHTCWQAWEILLALMKQYQTKLIIVNETITLSLDDHASILIKPQKQIIKKNGFTYHSVSLNGSVEDKTIDIQSQ